MTADRFRAVRKDGNDVGIPTTSSHVDHFLFTGSAKTITVPADATIALFGSTGNFFANFHGSDAIIPAVDLTSGAGVVVNPTSRSIAGQTDFSLIAATGVIITIEWYI